MRLLTSTPAPPAAATLLTTPSSAGSWRLRFLVVGLFFLSGASGLLFETLWTRQLVLVFGSTTFAVSTVLTAFMAGLALGSFLAGRLVDRIAPRRAIALYGFLEVVIGVYGLLFPIFLGLLGPIHRLLWQHLHASFLTFSGLRFLVVFLLLLLPTTCMGATLPVLVRFYARSRVGLGKPAGLLYAVNTLGAVAGTFAAAFVLLPAIGVTRTTAVASGVDLALAAVAVALGLAGGGRLGAGASQAAIAQATRTGSEDTTIDVSTAPTHAAGDVVDVRPAERDPGQRARQFAVVAIAVSGFAGMVYEVAWTRALTLVVGSSVYAFALILIGFLAGLALGSAAYSRTSAIEPDQPANLSTIHLLIALLAFFGMMLTDVLPLAFLAASRLASVGPAAAFLLSFLLTSIVVVPPAFFMGMTFPATVATCVGTARCGEGGEEGGEVVARGSTARGGTGRTVGSVYALNTVGAILGSFCGGFVLVPLLGMQRTVAAMIVVGLALSSSLALLATRGRGRRLRLAAALGMLAVLVVTYRPWNRQVMTAGVFRLSRYQEVAASMLGGHSGSGGSAAAGRSGGSDRGGGSVGEGGRRATRGASAASAWLRAARSRVPVADVLDATFASFEGQELLYYREGIVTTVSTSVLVSRGISDKTCWASLGLKVNGKADASLLLRFGAAPDEPCLQVAGRALRSGAIGLPSPSGDAETQVLSGILPFLLRGSDGDPRRALVIGWGSGLTVGAALQAAPEHLEVVELEQAVMEGARPFRAYNHAADLDPRVGLLVNDGRNYLEVTPERYDVIISEPSNPWMTGVSNLFTRECFETIAARLQPGGLFLQWLQVYEISPENVRSVLRTLAGRFREVAIFQPQHSRADLLLVASQEPLLLDWSSIERRMGEAAARRELAALDIRRPEDIVARLLLDPTAVRNFAAGAPENTDDNVRIEFSTPRDLVEYRRYSHRAITLDLARRRGDVLALSRNSPPDAAGRLADAYLRVGLAGSMERLAAGRNGSDWERRRKLARLLRLAPGELPLPAQSLAPLWAAHPRRVELEEALRRPAGEAMERVALLLDLASEERLGLELLGNLYSAVDDCPSAMACLHAAAAIGPLAAPSRLRLGKCLQQLGGHERALRWLEESMQESMQ